tara:strand:- start:5 stop:283 length:279 start_codon:yes stop_codon:yes gene_type:complete
MLLKKGLLCFQTNLFLLRNRLIGEWKIVQVKNLSLKERGKIYGEQQNKREEILLVRNFLELGKASCFALFLFSVQNYSTVTDSVRTVNYSSL